MNCEVDNNMSSREMYNLIIKLENKGLSAEEIIEIIKFIEVNRLTEEQIKEQGKL